MSDLHTRLLVELGKPYEIWAPSNVVTPIARQRSALLAVVELCVEHMTEAVDGGLTNADTIPPTEILAAIADQLGLTEGTDRGHG